MSCRFSLKGTLVGLVGGAAVTAVGIGFFTVMVDKTWPMRVMQISSWLGFWAMSDWYGGFPTNVNTTLTTMLLVLAGALQWAAVGLLYDLSSRFWLSRRP